MEGSVTDKPDPLPRDTGGEAGVDDGDELAADVPEGETLALGRLAAEGADSTDPAKGPEARGLGSLPIPLQGLVAEMHRDQVRGTRAA